MTTFKIPLQGHKFFYPAPIRTNSNCPKCGKRCERIKYTHITPNVTAYYCLFCGAVEEV